MRASLGVLSQDLGLSQGDLVRSRRLGGGNNVLGAEDSHPGWRVVRGHIGWNGGRSPELYRLTPGSWLSPDKWLPLSEPCFLHQDAQRASSRSHTG